MSIKILYIPFNHKGSTEHFLRQAIEKINSSDYSKILYIAQTPRKVRDSQKRFHDLIGGCYIPPEMVTIKQLAKRLYSLYGDKKVIPQSIISIIISRLSEKGIGFASIITNFINEIKQHHPNKDIETIGNELKAIFHKLGIPEEVSVRTVEALGILKAYQELLNKYSAVDENDVMAVCPDLIRRHDYSHSTLILDGFYEPTGSEEAIIKTLIENAKDTFISIPYDINFNSIIDSYISFIKNNFQVEETYLSTIKELSELLYHPYSSREEEIEGIARNIKNYFISGKIKDLEKITVTFPALYNYIEPAARIFRKYGIPYTISTTKPAGKTRPFLDLIALLESVADNYPRLSFSQCLISPYFKNMPSALREWIPHICLRSGIIKGKEVWLNLFKSEVRSQKSKVRDNNGFPDIEKELKWVFKKLASLESIKNKANYNQFCEVTIKLLNDLDFSDGTKDINLKEKVLEIIKEISFINDLSESRLEGCNGTAYASHISPITLCQFIDTFKHILNVTETEAEGTGVQITGFLDLRGIEPEYLYLGGLKDGDLPSKPDIDHILPDSVRTQFGLVNLKKYLLLQKFTFRRAIESTKNLHLSYPVMENDRFFLPSPFLPWNREIKQRVYGIFSEEEELVGKGRIPFASYIKDIKGIGEGLIKKKFGKDSFIRVTDIDSYKACPRRFFIEKVLHLEPMEIKKYEVEAALLGTIVHEIMQALMSRPFADLEELRIIAEETMDKFLSNKPVEDYWKKVIKDTFLSILPDIYKLESKLKEEGYSFMRAEVPVEGEIIKGIRLKGKIDRVDKKIQNSKEDDLCPDVVELIDYKTGTIQFSGPQVITKGATLQLFLYAVLMKVLGFKVERVGIYSLKDIKLSWIPGKNDRKAGRTMEDYIETSLRFLDETVSKMRSEDFSASPLNEQTCRNCPERPYCPYIQKTVIGHSDK